jgi:alkylation response protein AidB-like acyl-CoA dehydrogenase
LAQDTDQAAIVPRSHLEALADAGLCGLAGPGGHGGRAAPPSVTRPVYEALAGACGVTFFVWVQHHAPVRLLARSHNAELRDRWLAGLCQGSVLGGVAFAYLRRPGPPAVVARPVPGGWTVRGEAPWVTSWGLARLFAVAAVVSPDEPTGGEAGQAVFFLLDADAAGPSVRPSPPLAMAAMGASATVRLVFDDLFVPDDEVTSTIDLGHWRGRDRAATSQPHPAPFGLATTATRLLAEQARLAGDAAGRPAVDEAARSLAAELDRCRSRAYALSDSDLSGEGHLDDLVAARARSLDLAMRSAQALVAATGGRAMGLDHPAQRLVREAAFWSIQAQSPALRTATLGIVSAPR